jgi:hypothetical protein
MIPQCLLKMLRGRQVIPESRGGSRGLNNMKTFRFSIGFDHGSVQIKARLASSRKMITNAQ